MHQTNITAKFAFIWPICYEEDGRKKITIAHMVPGPGELNYTVEWTHHKAK